MAAIIRIQKNALILAILFLPTSSVSAGYDGIRSESQTGDARLQKDVNWLPALSSFLSRNNTNFDSGPFNCTQNVRHSTGPFVNISSYWKVIVRIVQPVTWQFYPNQNTGGEYGFGDMALRFSSLSPRHPGKPMGFGPAFAIPT